MMRATSSGKDLALFVALCLVVYFVEAFTIGSFTIALGGTPIQLIVYMAVGRLILWFSEQIYFFCRNITSDEPTRRFDRTFWQDMSLSLVIGIPPVLWLRSQTPEP